MSPSPRSPRSAPRAPRRIAPSDLPWRQPSGSRTAFAGPRAGVLRPGRRVEEVPGSKASLLALDEQPALFGRPREPHRQSLLVIRLAPAAGLSQQGSGHTTYTKVRTRPDPEEEPPLCVSTPSGDDDRSLWLESSRSAVLVVSTRCLVDEASHGALTGERQVQTTPQRHGGGCAGAAATCAWRPEARFVSGRGRPRRGRGRGSPRSASRAR